MFQSEEHVIVDGRPVPATMFDIGTFLYHNAKYMNKNSTIKLKDILLKEDFLFEEIQKNTTANLEAKQETINTILAYASSVKGIKIKSFDKILISLN